MTRLRNSSTAQAPIAYGDGAVFAVRAAGRPDGMT
jgi:hypothetical protein